MARMVLVGSKPHTSATRARETLNTWVVIALIVILIMVLLMIELNIHELEYPVGDTVVPLSLLTG